MTEALPSEGRIHMGTSRTGMRKAGGGGGYSIRWQIRESVAGLQGMVLTSLS